MDDNRDFLVKDFDHWTEAYFRNEEAGERRLSLFIGVVTAVMGGLGFLANKGDTVDLAKIRGIGCGALSGLVVLGVLTLLRIVRRNATTDGYLHALGSLREHLAGGELVAEYTSRLTAGRSLWNGGLAHVTAFLNAGLAGLCAWLARDLVAGLVLFALAAVVQTVFFIPWLNRRARKRDAPNTFRPNVGLLVTDGAGRVLALNRRDVGNAWQLPQGGIEAHEEPEEAAWRELREETGLTRDNTSLVRAAGHWLAYELPAERRSVKTGRGQAQRWFLFRVKSTDSVTLTPDGKEAQKLEWRPLQRVIDEAVDFRKPVYQAVGSEFSAELESKRAS